MFLHLSVCSQEGEDLHPGEGLARRGDLHLGRSASGLGEGLHPGWGWESASTGEGGSALGAGGQTRPRN